MHVHSTDAEAPVGVGGVVADPQTVNFLWRLITGAYRRELENLHRDVRDVYSPAHDSDAIRYARAGEYALLPGGRATAKLLMSDLAARTQRELVATLITDCHFHDPFIGVTVVRPNRHCIAWHANCGGLIEQSPLFNALVTSCERVVFATGEGAVHAVRTGKTDELFWHVGDGAALLGLTPHRA